MYPSILIFNVHTKYTSIISIRCLLDLNLLKFNIIVNNSLSSCIPDTELREHTECKMFLTHWLIVHKESVQSIQCLFTMNPFNVNTICIPSVFQLKLQAKEPKNFNLLLFIIECIMFMTSLLLF